MSKITQSGVIFNTDSVGNPVIKEIVVEKIISVPNSQLPDTNKIISVVSGISKTAIGIFSHRQEITLTNVYAYLGNITFLKSDYEDSVTSFIAKIEYVFEVDSSNSKVTFKLFDFTNSVLVPGSEITSEILSPGKYKLLSNTLTLPNDSIMECWGQKISGSASFLSSKIQIEKKRKL